MARSAFRPLGEVGDIEALACSAGGEIIGIEQDGVVRLLATTPEPRWLPLELDRRDVDAVLLHPDGRRVFAWVGGEHPLLRIHDAWTGALLRTLDPGLQLAIDHSTRHPASILDHRSWLSWRLMTEVAHCNPDRMAGWLEPEAREILRDVFDRCDVCRVVALALHPNHRWLAVLDRGCFVIDLDAGLVMSTIAVPSTPPGYEACQVHTMAIDSSGSVVIASTVGGSNEDAGDYTAVVVDRFDAASGHRLSTTYTCKIGWGESERREGSTAWHTVEEPTDFLPIERIPPGECVVRFQPSHLEVWSRTGLVRTIPLRPQACVVPSFDPANTCPDPRVLLIDDEGFTLVDLVHGQRTRCRPRLADGEVLNETSLRGVDFVSGGAELVLWTNDEMLMSVGGDAWSSLLLPQGHVRVTHVLGVGESLVAVVHDHRGELWIGELERKAAAMPTRSLAELESALVDDPDTIENYLVYADALTQKGDPRGELILLQLHGALAEADALIKRHAPTLLGGLSSLHFSAYKLEWRLGFVRTARVRVKARELPYLIAFLGTDSARLLERLVVDFPGTMDARDPDDPQPDFEAFLAAAARWPRLQVRFAGSRGRRPSAWPRK